jgi:hypothetical protein
MEMQPYARQVLATWQLRGLRPLRFMIQEVLVSILRSVGPLLRHPLLRSERLWRTSRCVLSLLLLMGVISPTGRVIPYVPSSTAARVEAVRRATSCACRTLLRGIIVPNVCRRLMVRISVRRLSLRLSVPSEQLRAREAEGSEKSFRLQAAVHNRSWRRCLCRRR